MAPINHFAPGRVSVISFILVNLWIDGAAIRNWLFNLPIPDHPPTTHSFLGALVLGAVVALFGFRSRKWIYGALLGAVSHVLLDMLVHSEMRPLYPLQGNPFFAGLMEPLSMVLIPLTCWFIVQFVSGIRDWLGRRLAAERARTQGPSA